MHYDLLMKYLPSLCYVTFFTLGNRQGWRRYRNLRRSERKRLNWGRKRPEWQMLQQQTRQSNRLLQGGDVVWE